MLPLFALFLLLFALPAWSASLHHRIEATIEPERHWLSAVDTITFPQPLGKGEAVEFALHAGLHPAAVEDAAELRLVERSQGPVPWEHYRLRLREGGDKVTLRYAGPIHHRLQESSAGVGLRQEETPGIIGPEGVYLNGASGWYPDFGAPLTFALTVRLPPGWSAVSQGAGTAQAGSAEAGVARWQELQPQDTIYFIGAPFSAYNDKAGEVETQVFLRRPDPGLARRYLDAAAHYLPLYHRLIGPYPYAKFALIENFWETGYGMPSFTLLGPQVIRLPFILHSSYPHEILHNWWGNGVYVDYERGNWSEGLTAYLADHLIQESEGAGTDYRRDNLQKYAEYVAHAREGPLRDFRSRHDEASQALGYGKALMLFHMLRLEVGDRAFLEGLRRFYRQERFRTAAYGDLEGAFEAATGRELKWFFQQWVARTGAPRLEFHAETTETEGGYRLHGLLRQSQDGEAYRLRVPLAVHLEGRPDAVEFDALMEGQELRFERLFETRPLAVSADPRFDLFRRLDVAELPPAVGRLFGAEELHLVLPAQAPEESKAAYQSLAAQWAGRDERVRVHWDRELAALPGGAVWLLGWENRFRPATEEALRGQPLEWTLGEVRLKSKPLGETVVLVTEGRTGPLGWLATTRPQALVGLARKLPHYSKYGYLGFSGPEPLIQTKGRWPLLDSPLTVRFVPTAPPPRLAPRAPLSSLVQ